MWNRLKKKENNLLQIFFAIRYYKFGLFDLTEFVVSKVFNSGCKDLRLRE